MGLRGTLQLFNSETGALLYENQNLITDAGLSLLMDRMKDNTADALSYIAIGTDDTVADISQTALLAETSRDGVSNITAGVGSLVVEREVDALDEQYTWKEVAIFNAAVAGTMFNRIVMNFVKGNFPVTIKFTIYVAR